MSFEESEEHSRGAQDRWLVSYADFITLLFAFFTILYATSDRDLEKTKEFQDSVKKYLVKAGAFGGTGEKINQGEKFNTVIEPPIETYDQAKPETENVKGELENQLESALSAEDLRKVVLDISSDDLGVRIVLAGQQLFANGSTQFRPAILDVLQKMGAIVAKLNKKILIEGHSQEKAAPYNNEWEFAAARAITLVRYLAKVHKVDNNRLMALSYGSQRPYDDSKSKNADQLNERVEVVILNGDISL